MKRNSYKPWSLLSRLDILVLFTAVAMLGVVVIGLSSGLRSATSALQQAQAVESIQGDAR